MKSDEVITVQVVTKSRCIGDSRVNRGVPLATTISEPKGPQIKIDFESMGVVPYIFVAILFGALLKFTKGRFAKKTVEAPASAITSAEQEKELHVYKCSGCGYELWVARGREFKFFGDSYKCPVCETDKSGFWDLNDPTDPRNMEDSMEDESDTKPTDVDKTS
eukprot:CAMPEP_0182447060 /NCGR_PEP_ID=MMETSP1172-20130603/10959_1 /TAXON_ID=708627 /ORGANISM="Timspurckia oligopyrenoides, Strain CCMP3278" /LENGTH=162 /DNA_ID=CAMNT_0024643339 /DNA_START=375 /DNA_END=863 /DNA_ORIENTATION=-